MTPTIDSFEIQISLSQIHDLAVPATLGHAWNRRSVDLPETFAAVMELVLANLALHGHTHMDFPHGHM